MDAGSKSLSHLGEDAADDQAETQIVKRLSVFLLRACGRLRLESLKSSLTY